MPALWMENPDQIPHRGDLNRGFVSDKSRLIKDTLLFVSSCVIASALIAISLIDLETFLIPDYLNFTVLIFSFVVALRTSFLEHLISFLIVTTIFLVLKVMYRDGLGAGDVILAMGIGFLLPPVPSILPS